MFTSDQINEIKNKLQLFGKKDSSFPKVDKCYSDDSIAIVQEGTNKQISIGKLLNSISIEYIDNCLDSLINNLLKVKLVTELPPEGDPTIIYLVPNEQTEEGNLYTEYLWIPSLNKYEVIGSIGVLVDDTLNGTSTNPIQNKAVYTAIQGLDGRIEVIDDSVTDLKTDNEFIKRDVNTLIDKVFPFKVAVSIDKTLAQKGTTATANITVKAYQGDDITQVDTILINGTEYHGNIPYTTQVTATTNTTYNVRVEKEDKIASSSVSIRFVALSYSGVVASNFVINAANVKALTSSLQGGKNRTLTFNLNNQKSCIAYPKEFGAAASIKDGNNFDYLDSYTRTEVTIDGEAYYVYLLSNPTTITDFKQIIN